MAGTSKIRVNDVRINSNIFVPKELGANDDSRKLEKNVDFIEVVLDLIIWINATSDTGDAK